MSLYLTSANLPLFFSCALFSLTLRYGHHSTGQPCSLCGTSPHHGRWPSCCVECVPKKASLSMSGLLLAAPSPLLCHSVVLHLTLLSYLLFLIPSVVTCALGLKVLKVADIVNRLAIAWIVCFLICALALEMSRQMQVAKVRLHDHDRGIG